MPPAPGVGKKMGGSIARQRSRNTTPSASSVAAAAAAAAASNAASTPNNNNVLTTSAAAARSATPLPTANLPDTTRASLKLFDNEVELLVLERNLAYDDLVDAGCGTGSNLPDYRSVDGIIERLKKLQDMTDDHGRNFDRGMRLLSQIRRTRMDQVAEDRSREEERLQRELAHHHHDDGGGGGGGGGGGDGGANDDGDGGHHHHNSQKRANKKKRKAPPTTTTTTATAAAADGDAALPSDAMDVDDKKTGGDAATGSSSKDKDKDKDGNSKKKGAGPDESGSESESSEDDGAPPPRPLPQHQTFGEDPSTFPDPTVYEIRAVTPNMSMDEIKEIYSVASFPKSDLADLVAGTPPDKDFSNAKPSNQINFSTFSTYIEPYFRPFTEEDLAFLRERGNRVAPFAMPKRGKRHYTEIWAEEDGAMAIDTSPTVGGGSGGNGSGSGNGSGNGGGGGGGGGDSGPHAPNQPRGSIENMADEVAETDSLSVGPLLSRLLAAMRPEHRPPDGNSGSGGDGDVSMNGNDPQHDAPPPPPPSFSFSAGGGGGGGGGDGDKHQLAPAAHMPESATESWKKAAHPKLEYKQVDERIKQELRHIGFLPFPDPLAANGAAGVNGVNGVNGVAGGGAVTNGLSAGTTNGVMPNGTANGINGTSSSTSNGITNGTANGSAATNDNAVDPALAADYDGHFDDEIAARLRRLQAALREQMLVNGARKARLADLVKERMAYQEYQTILEDLDGQVNAAYLKRTRTMGKTKKGKRPGGAGGGAAGASAAAAAAAAAAAGTARPGIGDLTRTLMERRKRWMESIGTVFDDEKMRRVPRTTDPNSSVFHPDDMAGYLKREKEAWDEEVDEE